MTSDKWVALDHDTYEKHDCGIIGREQEYDRDANDVGFGFSGIGPEHDGEYITNCKYCDRSILWKVVREGEEERRREAR
jgi:hypothetical protein